MPKLSSDQLDFFALYEKFIGDSSRGKRMQPNGKKISAGTVENYRMALQSVKKFSETKMFPLRIRAVRRLNNREVMAEKNYWKRFYRNYTDYLYKEEGLFDNSVGSCIKNLKVFFNYLNKDLSLGIGEFHRQFYVPKEDIAIFPLMPEELRFLIEDTAFEKSLSPSLKRIKDFFVFGCTVALRFSDLVVLQKNNLRIVNNQHYLSVKTVKTSAATLVKLPAYAVAILEKYKHQKRYLLPINSLNRTNLQIKELLKRAGFTYPVRITRNRRGVPVERLYDARSKAVGEKRFCDVASSHTMRRTAITTMLSLGMQEQLVRKISGHAPASKEFYRYTYWAQDYQDKATEKMFSLLVEKNIPVSV